MNVLLITGTREEPIPDSVIAKLRRQIRWADHVVLGDCPTGIDRIAWMLVLELDTPHDRLEADWNTHGKRAGPIRNEAMTKRVAELASDYPKARGAAYPSLASTGTWDCIKRAVSRDIITTVELVEPIRG